MRWGRVFAKWSASTFAGLFLAAVCAFGVAEGAVADYEGTYSGTYSGSDYGTWTMKCNAQGSLFVVIWSDLYNLGDGGSGFVTTNGVVSATIEGGGVLNGKIDASGHLTGTWAGGGESGTVSGRRNLPGELAVFAGSYTGTFSGLDSGTWSASIDLEGFLSVTIWSNADQQSYPGYGFVNYTGEFISETENGAFQHGTISQAGLMAGIWQVEDIGGGTLSGTRVPAQQKPAVSTGSATLVTTVSAFLNATVNPNGVATTYHFDYGTSTAYGLSTADVAAGEGSASVDVAAAVSGLSPGTLYHFRVVAANAAGTTHGGDQTFSTSAVLIPTVTTRVVSGIGHDSAHSGGTVLSDGGASIAARGVCWSLAVDPTVADSKTVDGSGTGTFTSVMTGLSHATPYHVRAYATNSSGTGYGSSRIFFTHAAAPAATTRSASKVTGDSATLNGSVNPNGDPSDVYFEYGLTTAYGFSTPRTYTGSGIRALAVSDVIDSLLPDTVYHFRMVATNSIGIVAGGDEMFSTQMLYVDPAGACADNTPCYTTIQAAINDADSGATIKIIQGTCDEDLVSGSSKALIFSGGWNNDFTAQSSYTVICTLAVSGGTIAVDRVVAGCDGP